MTDETPPRSLDLRVPCDVLSVAVVRRRFADHLLTLGSPDRVVHDGAMVLSELLMNAIVHGDPDDAGQVGAAWSVDDDGTLTVRVTDSGGRTPAVASPDADAGGGRGLQLVESLSETWSTSTDDGTTAVVAVLRSRPLRAVRHH